MIAVSFEFAKSTMIPVEARAAAGFFLGPKMIAQS
jgi:hypothetical protein